MLVAALCLGTALAGCSKETTSAPRDGACETVSPPVASAAATTSTGSGALPDGSRLRVGLALANGRGDGGFNDAAAAGLDRAKAELHLADTRETAAALGEGPAVLAGRLRQLASNGFNPVIAQGFLYLEPIQTVAKEFPQVQFAILDAPASGPNLRGLSFAEEQGAFLAGVIAARKSKACHVGFIGGVDIPLIHKFGAGFKAGAEAAAPKVKVDSRYLTAAGDLAGFISPDKGSEAAKGFIDGGADVLFHSAAASGKGVVAAAHAAHVLAIGCDADQYTQPVMAEYKDAIITSMIKRLDVAVFEYLRAIAANDLSKLPTVFDLRNDGLTYATSGGRVDDLKADLDAYKAAIISGAIKVPQQ
ncbi:BMP family ABC transporter substrate-binding protein [Pseudonocardiaceae bacterium YIM PH 21723]|nr:BMP family ABC transporter substrate-binding protein [Pseudonocardiaceae bacterium YIM PH 21723]